MPKPTNSENQSQTIVSLDTQTTYYVVGKKIQTTARSSSFYPEDRKSIPSKEIKEAVPTGDALLFRTKEEAMKYASDTRYEGGGSDHNREAPVFEVQLKTPINNPSIVKEEIITYQHRKKSVEYIEVNANNLRFINGEILGFKTSFEPAFKTAQDWLDKIGFDKSIADLRKKAALLKKDEHFEAAKELVSICDNLEKSKNQFVKGDKKVREFIEDCKHAVDPEKTKELAKHRGIFAQVKSFIQSVIQKINPDFQFTSGSMKKISEFDKSLDPLKEINNLLSLSATLLSKPKEEFDSIFDPKDSQVLTNKMSIGRRLMREGVTSDLFATQEEYESWKTELISIKNKQTEKRETSPPREGDTATLPNKVKVRINIIKIPANEREENILAVYSALNNDELIRNKDGSIPNLIKEIRDIVGKLDPSKEEDIANAIIEIKSKIIQSRESNYTENARDIINAFAKPGCCDFHEIRANLNSNPAINEIMSSVGVDDRNNDELSHNTLGL
ncbi:TPA: hypothetical protein ACX87D_000529 [Legionella pneumophila]